MVTVRRDVCAHASAAGGLTLKHGELRLTSYRTGARCAPPCLYQYLSTDLGTQGLVLMAARRDRRGGLSSQGSDDNARWRLSFDEYQSLMTHNDLADKLKLNGARDFREAAAGRRL